jgi:hypothetical protein
LIPFFRKIIHPRFDRTLLIESGSRAVSERWLAWASKDHPQAMFDLVTCYLGTPSGADFGDRVYHTAGYPSKQAREELAKELAANGYTAVVMLCTAEPIMTRWKWFLAWRVGAPTVVINENADWFPFNAAFARTILHFVSFRAGLSGAGILTQPLRLIALPFVVLYLALYAAAAHFRRRLYLRKVSP